MGKKYDEVTRQTIPLKIGEKMKTRIHVNQHHIKRNNIYYGKKASTLNSLPVITVKDYKQNRTTNRADIVDSKGQVVASVVYNTEKPLPCGAKVWIETNLEVKTTQLCEV